MANWEYLQQLGKIYNRLITIYNLKYSFSKIFIKKMLMLLLEKTYIWFCRSDDVHFRGSFHETNIGHLLTCHQRKIYSYLNVHLGEGKRYSLINYWKVAKCSFCLKYRIFKDHEFANIVRKRMGRIVTVDHKTNIRFSYKYNCSVL